MTAKLVFGRASLLLFVADDSHSSLAAIQIIGKESRGGNTNKTTMAIKMDLLGYPSKLHLLKVVAFPFKNA